MNSWKLESVNFFSFISKVHINKRGNPMLTAPRLLRLNYMTLEIANRLLLSNLVVRAKILDLTPVSSGGQNGTNKIRMAGRLGVFKLPNSINSPANLEFRMDCDCPIVKAAITRPKGPGRWLLMGKLDASKNIVTVRENEYIKRRDSVTFIQRVISPWCNISLSHPGRTLE